MAGQYTHLESKLIYSANSAQRIASNSGVVM